GFFPRRFLVAKIRTARRLQADIGGRVVYFCHDSDHDPRETRTILRHRATGQPAHLNFAIVSKLQRKFSPLYAKRITADWHARTLPGAAGGLRKEEISPTPDTRLRWMQSVIHCTHYVTGAGEQAYLRPEDAPEIAYVRREEIERSNEAFTELSG